MRYLKFRIQNYKGIDNLLLELDKKPLSKIITLVGLNECGKTTILEAINLFQEDVSEFKMRAMIPKKQEHSFSSSVKIKARLEFSENDMIKLKKILSEKCDFRISDLTKRIVDVSKNYNFTRSNPNNSYCVRSWSIQIKGVFQEQHKIIYVDELAESNTEVWLSIIEIIADNFIPRIIYYRDFVFDFPKRIYLEEYSEIDANKERKSIQKRCRGILGDLLGDIDDGISFTELLDNMKISHKNNYDEELGDALGSLLEKISKLMNEKIIKLWRDVFEINNEYTIKINPIFEPRNPDDIEDDKNESLVRCCLEIKIAHKSNLYSIGERSAGFRWFFSFVVLTLFRKDRSNEPGETLLLLDEPASNLHQRAQKKLLKHLGEISTNRRVIYSTHSHHLINPSWLCGAYVVKNNAIDYLNIGEPSSHDTDITAIPYSTFVASNSNQQDYFQPILDALQYQPSKLEYVPFIVITEGKFDYYYLKYFIEIVFENKYNINLYPGAGANKQEFIIRLYMSWGKSFLCLFDSDKKGIKSKELYINKVKEGFNEKAFTYQDINPDWKDYQIENLFSSEEEKNYIINEAFNTGKNDSSQNYTPKGSLGSAIIQFYCQKKLINFEDKTKNNFKTVLDYLENKLIDLKTETDIQLEND